MVQHFAATAAHPALSYSVLPGTTNACAGGLDPARLQKRKYIRAELRVTIEQHILIATGKRQSFAQLLYDPIACRICRGIEVQDLPPRMFDYKEAIKHAKR
jgi:hypothetical protein